MEAVAVKERPIIFKGEMVRAILEGRKTQTRRIIQPQPDSDGGWTGCTSMGDHNIAEFCPYGLAGDRLWVRETWRIVGWWEGMPYLLEYKDGTRLEESGDSSEYDDEKYADLSRQCDDECMNAGIKTDEEGAYRFAEGQDIPTRWRPSIHMPRWASRILLEITEVRVERVQDITEEDVRNEGVIWKHPHAIDFDSGMRMPKQNALNWARAAFRELWDSIHDKGWPSKKHPYRWGMNPWVWVISFKQIKHS